MTSTGRRLAMLRLCRFARALLGLLASVAVIGTPPEMLSAQTFVQLADLDPPNGVGPRLTSNVVRNKLGRELFADLTAKITLVDAVANPPIAYEFTSDGVWNRILFGQKDVYINQFFNSGASRVAIAAPGGLDISATRNLYVADRMNERVLVARFDATTRSLTEVADVSGPVLRGVVDVAWDGRQAPLTSDYFYALNGGGSVSYWALSGTSATLQWTYGAAGSGPGQFRSPLGVCVGRATGPAGGSVHTTDFYVADGGNRRVVWLQRTQNGASWTSAVPLPDGGVPSDCAVDHFGNVIVVDSLNSRLLKYTWNLTYLDQYGAYGVGAGNHNTFANPHAVHTPFGSKTSGGGTVWYGEGRVITAERWGSQSGAREHYLGLMLARTSGPDTSTGVATFGYRVTDHSYHTVFLYDDATGQVVHEWYRGLMPSGDHTWFWSGSGYPGGYYHFAVHALSAYGCSIPAQSWCDQMLYTPSFWNPGPPPPPPPRPPCDPNCTSAPAPDEAAPAALFLRQRVFMTGRPLARIAGPAASAPDVSATTPAGSLSELVRQYGVRGLSFGIPRASAASLVGLRVYTAAGRLVRVLLNERLEPGFYELGWDGLDQSGRPVAPGVYFAVMSVGSYRATQRLIIRQPS